MDRWRAGNRNIDLIGTPLNSAGTTDGVARAPRALRRAGLIEAIVAAGCSVIDRGDVAVPPLRPVRDPDTHVIAAEALAAMTRSVRRAVEVSLESGRFPLVLGGDCPVLIGCVAAIAETQLPGLLFVDGHEDAWPADRSTTGEAADMELGWLLGRGVEDLPSALRDQIPRPAPDRVLVLGPRDAAELAEAEVESIEGLVRVVRPPAITGDPTSVAESAVSALDARGPWWLHVDLDVLSTESLAAVDYQQEGGLDWHVLTELTRRSLASPNVVGWTVTIYNPDLDPAGKDAARIVRFIVDALGSDGEALTRS